jgi:hypothetical protein
MKTLSLLILAVSLFAGLAFAQSVGPGTGIGASGTASGNSADVNAKNKTNAGMSGAKSTTGAIVNTQTPADSINAGVNSNSSINAGGEGNTLNTAPSK